MDVVFVRWIVRSKSIRAHSGFDMNYRGAVIGQMFAYRGSRCKGRELYDFDALERLHDD